MKKLYVILFYFLFTPCAYAQITDFDDISNLKFWFEADSISGLSDGDDLLSIENTWENLVYAGGDSGLSALGDPRQPTWETNEINTTKSAVFFDSTLNSEALRIDGTTDLNYARFTHQWDKTIFIVMKIPLDSDVPRIPLDSRQNAVNQAGMTLRILDDGAGNDGKVNTHAGPVGSNNFNFNSANNAFTYGSWQLLTVWASTTDDTARTFVNGVQVGKQVITGTEPSGNSSQNFSVGLSVFSNPITSIDGFIALLVIYDRALTDEERCQARDLISCRFPEEFSDDAGCEVTCPEAAAANMGVLVRRRGLHR